MSEPGLPTAPDAPTAARTLSPPAGQPGATPESGRPPAGSARRWLWLAALIFVLDQLTKWLILAALDPYEVVPVASWLNLTLVFNPGAAFSFLADAGGWQRWLFAAFALIVGVGLSVWLWRLPRGERLLAAGLALLVGGAFGNLVDRVLFGHVVDFVQVFVPFIPLAIFNPWPSFNVADSAITVGVILVLLTSMRGEGQEARSPT